MNRETPDYETPSGWSPMYKMLISPFSNKFKMFVAVSKKEK